MQGRKGKASSWLVCKCALGMLMGDAGTKVLHVWLGHHITSTN
jgi:hypothetical protein